MLNANRALLSIRKSRRGSTLASTVFSLVTKYRKITFLTKPLVEPAEGDGLHLKVEFVRAGVELAAVVLRRADGAEMPSQARIGGTHALFREQVVLEVVLHQQRRGGAGRSQVGPVAAARPAMWLNCGG